MLPRSEDHTRLIHGLNAWAETSEPHVAAAVRLLISHEHWVRDETVVGLCMTTDVDGLVWVHWADLRRRFDAGEFARGSTTERAVLDFAISLGENRYRTTAIGPHVGARMFEAFGNALGVTTPS